MLASLPAATKFIVAVVLVGTWYGNASSTSVEGGMTEATLSPVLTSARKEAVASEEWTTLILDGGTPKGRQSSQERRRRNRAGVVDRSNYGRRSLSTSIISSNEDVFGCCVFHHYLG
ncbi:unnamed protein product [Ectocarpus fasciculatus]